MRLVLISFFILLGITLYGDYEFFQKLKNQEFGKELIMTIQTELKQNNRYFFNINKNTTLSVDRIITLLRQMQEDLSHESKEENEKLKRFTDTCTERLSSIEEILNKSTERKADKERLLPLLNEEQKNKKRQADDKLTEEERNNQKIAELTKVRLEERTIFEQKRDELTFLAGNLQSAKKIFSKLQTGSFLQTKQSIFTQLKEQHEKLLSKFPSQHMMMTLLLEIARLIIQRISEISDPGIQANQQLVNKLMALFDELIESVFELLTKEMKAEASREQNYQNLKARLELRNRRLEGTIAELRATVQLTEQQILELNNDINSLKEIISTKSTEQSDWNQTCNLQQITYDQQKSNRNDRVEIIQKCIEIFEIGVQDVPSFIQTLEIK